MYKYPYMQNDYIYLIPNNLAMFIKVNNQKSTCFLYFCPKFGHLRLNYTYKSIYQSIIYDKLI